ncbi:ORF14 protein [Operophtera brumata nucleopolyhedrovirus]|uniref:ORF14 protein n=1 Tax=Operophtera brumata nucleopolyhedrovirus TaxID=1046267 RepID=A0A2H4UZQ7_9ABAC|nr:ORF14 protein [Operophtera brumata nucleopolyhedrovirus]AUA60245.1 ORF14 protein [Operophtera brumata nucleopolyhedrovirus]
MKITTLLIVSITIFANYCNTTKCDSMSIVDNCSDAINCIQNISSMMSSNLTIVDQDDAPSPYTYTKMGFVVFFLVIVIYVRLGSMRCSCCRRKFKSLAQDPHEHIQINIQDERKMIQTTQDEHNIGSHRLVSIEPITRLDYNSLHA